MNVDTGMVVAGIFQADHREDQVVILLVRDLVPNLGGWGRHGFLGDRLIYREGAGSRLQGLVEEVALSRPGTIEDEAAVMAVRDRVARDNQRVLEAAGHPSAAEVMEREG